MKNPIITAIPAVFMSLIVAPVVEKGARSRSVVLPNGEWKAEDGMIHSGGGSAKIGDPLQRLPYFVGSEGLISSGHHNHFSDIVRRIARVGGGRVGWRRLAKPWTMPVTRVSTVSRATIRVICDPAFSRRNAASSSP